MFEWKAHPEQRRKQTTKMAEDAKSERTIEGSMFLALSKCKGVRLAICLRGQKKRFHL
jgi:hypothetical protein